MSDDISAVCVIATMTAMVGLIIGGMGGYQNGWNQGVTTMQRQAVEHGYGEHDAKTGQWRWVERVAP